MVSIYFEGGTSSSTTVMSGLECLRIDEDCFPPPALLLSLTHTCLWKTFAVLLTVFSTFSGASGPKQSLCPVAPAVAAASAVPRTFSPHLLLPWAWWRSMKYYAAYVSFRCFKFLLLLLVLPSQLLRASEAEAKGHGQKE